MPDDELPSAYRVGRGVPHRHEPCCCRRQETDPHCWLCDESLSAPKEVLK